MSSSASLARVRLFCRGTLQGVGFRPMVLRLGTSLALTGWVRNRIGGVELDLVGERRQLEHVLELLPEALPPAARLESIEVTWLENLARSDRPCGLQIDAGDEPLERQPLGAGWLAPSLRADRVPCRTCWQEFNDPQNRRYRDPFIGCCDCGPRFAISTAIPFRRAHTSLDPLSLCEVCRHEAADPADRRFHCETISCPACGPQLRWMGEPAAADPLTRALDLLHRGGILALQGIAGFQLLVDAGKASAIERLRQRKQRPHQPLALLGRSVDDLGDAVAVSPAERRLLESVAAPIVLLRRRPGASRPWLGVADGAPCLGLMLPASGLHRLLVEGHGRPLVATSANRHGEPMWISRSEAEAGLGLIADGVLLHDRAIVRPLDDSVAQVIDGRPRLLRRARGYVPEPIRMVSGVEPSAIEPSAIESSAIESFASGPSAAEPPGVEPFAAGPSAAAPSAAGPSCDETAGAEPSATDPSGPDRSSPTVILALGADLKSAPALAIGERLWMAAPFGSLDHHANAVRFEAAVREVLKGHPEAGDGIVCEAHPGSRSSQLAHRLGRCCQPVAHYQAHGLAVLAEHGLSGPMVLLCADGVGFDPADDRATVRGCELLLVPAGPGPIRRLGGLLPFGLPGAELACLEPRRCALGLLLAIDRALVDHPGAACSRDAFSAEERSLVLSAIEGQCNTPPCTSLGRFFDGVASLLGLVQTLSFEGQGGLWLEGAAAATGVCSEAVQPTGPLAPSGMVVIRSPEGWQLDWRPWLISALDRLAAGVSRQWLAADFQRSLACSLAELTAQVAQGQTGASPLPIVRVALAGGCFQNASLLRDTAAQLRRRGLQPYWSEQVPCHDGGLALGQVAARRRQITADQAISRQPRHP